MYVCKSLFIHGIIYTRLAHKSDETNHLTKMPFEYVILEDRQSILLLLPSICWAYTPTYTPT